MLSRKKQAKLGLKNRVIIFVCACKSIVRDSVVGREKFHLKFIGSEGFLKYNPKSRNISFPLIGKCLGKTIIHAYVGS